MTQNSKEVNEEKGLVPLAVSWSARSSTLATLWRIAKPTLVLLESG